MCLSPGEFEGQVNSLNAVCFSSHSCILVTGLIILIIQKMYLPLGNGFHEGVYLVCNNVEVGGMCHVSSTFKAAPKASQQNCPKHHTALLACILPI